MTGCANEVEAISRQTQIKGSYQRAGREFARHEHVAKNADPLPGNHRLDCMQLLPEAQVIHVLGFRHVAPLASRSVEPSLPGWSLKVGRRPPAMNEDLSAKAGGALQARGKQFRTADGPEGIAQEILGDTVCWQFAGIADGDVGVAGMEIQNAIGADHVERRIGARLPPVGQAWDKPAARKGVCRCHTKRLRIPIALHGGESCDKRFEAVADDWKQAGSGLGQRERPRPPTKQSAPAITLQLSYLMADRCWRHAEFGRGLLETRMPRRGIKGAQLDQGRQLVHPRIVDENDSPWAELFEFAPGAAEAEEDMAAQTRSAP